MNIEYDKYYQTENLFGNPYPELLAFYAPLKPKGKLLDLGCGQGRDAIALARLGFEVTGIDYSQVGIEQLNRIATQENLPITGLVADIYTYTDYAAFDYILLDSMFHFQKKERKKGTDLLNRIFADAKLAALITICIQKTGNKLAVLEAIISDSPQVEIFHRTDLVYRFEDQQSNHHSETEYAMLSLKKIHS